MAKLTLETPSLASFAEREQLVRMLVNAEPSDAAGASLAFLLHLADTKPEVLRATLHARFDKPGHRPVAIIDILNRVAGKG